jgi:sRNA-binding regulator protein Hfq
MKMEVIRTYLDNVFAAYPQTGELQKIKRDMLANMEEKYSMLRQSGKNEHEAAYSVIADFGRIDEITDELGIETDEANIFSSREKAEPSIFLSREKAESYLADSKRSGIWIGLGVWLILAGVSTVVIFENAFLLFAAIAVAVMIFIFNGFRMNAYESYEETTIKLDPDTREQIEYECAVFKPRFVAMIAIGVGLIIFSVGALTVSDFFIPIFLNIVGFAVVLFVWAGCYSGAFDVILGKGDYAHKIPIDVLIEKGGCARKIPNKKGTRLIGTISAVYWPSVVAIYLLWSFFGSAWTISWVIFPVAGVLFGAISGGIAVWFGTSEKD